ncbi:transcription factor JunB [Latimeria chalumnae]|uniref:Transcription factor JunB n=1 Tax=Latimeria chalumnae TaxID=7897 RepID=H2ZWD3_LATCH|nr:PREDICTED: transcription factor jun-B [Latimeria chalumnae]|eukprot:XP_005994171.1 PREDICTED: transcription factor jun-B [Latimeria chalumnae]
MSTKMETPFYHDDSFLSGYGHLDSGLQDYKLLKQNMTLNLVEPYRSLKSHLKGHEDGYYTSQEPGSLKLASPELERLIIQNNNGVITTPTPAQYFYARGVTEEQEGFADGFVKALNELHEMNHMPPPNVSIGASGVAACTSVPTTVFGSSMHQGQPIYTDLSNYSQNTINSASNYPTATISYLPQPHHFSQTIPVSNPRVLGLKEEPQTVPDVQSRDGTPPMSPIDMENQERIKAERKRLRNRMAATKCRKRKLERIAKLEDKVKILKTENAGLSNTASVLREQVAQLKRKVLNHVSNGCHLMVSTKIQPF